MTLLENADFDPSSDPFTCLICYGTLTASRPPFLNLDNCSCTGALRDGDEPPVDLRVPRYSMSNAESNTTSVSSARGQEQGRESHPHDSNEGPIASLLEKHLPEQEGRGGVFHYSMDRYLQACQPPESSYHGLWRCEQQSGSHAAQDSVMGLCQPTLASSLEMQVGRSSIVSFIAHLSAGRRLSRRSFESQAPVADSIHTSGLCAGAGDWASAISDSKYKDTIDSEDFGCM